MSTVDEGLESQIRNIEEKYGKSLSEWIAIVIKSGLTKHTEIVAMLKSQYGMTHGSAHRIALKARDAASIAQAAKASGTDPVADLYTGKKAGLKPLHDALMNAITAFGNGIELAPKKGYVFLCAESSVRSQMAPSILANSAEASWDIWSTPVTGEFEAHDLDRSVFEKVNIPPLVSPQTAESSFGLTTLFRHRMARCPFDVMNVKRLHCQHFLHILLVTIGVGTSDGDAVCGSPFPVENYTGLQPALMPRLTLKAKRNLSPVGEGSWQKRGQGDNVL